MKHLQGVKVKSFKHLHIRHSQHTNARGLYVVALFEGVKGLLVLLAGFGLLSFIHKDLHRTAVRIIELAHLNPASHYPLIFLDLTKRITDARLWCLALGAAMYSVIRFIEAAGLWLRREWAQWFAILTGALYIPVELYEVTLSVTWPRITLLIINSGIVGYLVLVILQNEREKTS
jgi:uncharacterized membrane protein (DUF2068 family)